MTGFSILLSFWIYQDSKYAWVTQGPKKMLHQRCLTGFRIFLRFSVWQDSKYVWVTQDFEQNAPLYIFDRVLNMPAVLKWQGYRELRVLCKLYSRGSRCKLYSDGKKTNAILNMPQVFNIPWFWMYQESKYVKASQYTLKARQKFR